MSVETRLEAAARPVAVPETLVFDPATAATGSWFLSVCESLGVSLEAVSARQGGRAVAQTARVLAGLFTRHASAVAVAARPAGPGNDSVGQPPQAVLSLLHLQDEWITAVRHTRPQEALRHPLMLQAMLSPNEMWRVLPGAGAVPLPLDAQHFAELLPVRQVMGQIAPLAARPVLVEDRVHDLP
ncbi:hypothetical protein ACFZAG_36200 [Streptomyces sp. NPDC012403]|uniref:hypothetical protein n=1 Tax=Streptomyces sp. NPDC012403 TaxID=3364831 RepID=UPI0036E5346E